jgi:AcrR family transcriptional regulator
VCRPELIGGDSSYSSGVAGEAVTDGRRIRGDASRRLVLHAAMNQASVSGLDSISIGGVAEAAGLSKGGVATLFGSRERLQLATVEAAKAVFLATVIEPARPAQGIGRLRRVVDAWIAYSRDRTFEGGCFFASVGAEWAGRPGPVRDAIVTAGLEWTSFLVRAMERATQDGDLPAGFDAAQAAFEITALLDGANMMSLLHGSAAPYDRARTAIRRLLT